MKEKVMSLIRALLVAGGVFLVGSDINGWQITADFVQAAIGALMSGYGLYWAIKDKTITEDKFISTLKGIVIGLGGACVSNGLISKGTFNYISGFLLIVVPYVWGIVDRRRALRLRNASISAGQMVGARPKDNQNLF